MGDIVVTVPKRLWEEWIAEGDLPGDVWSGDVFYSFYVSQRPAMQPGDLVYIVAHGKLRGYAPLVRIDRTYGYRYALIRHGGAVAVTIPESIPGFRGFRYRWWNRSDEIAFDDWKTP